MATTVRITETYDMKTTKDQIGLIGIHTPTDALLRAMYPGLMKNHRFVRFLKCDLVGACASVLPADPLQVGVSSGAVAPEDMFNPILLRAVTNESFDTLVSRIYYANALSINGSVTETSTPSHTNDFNIYYSLLAENGKFKKAMPQRGFGMRGLVPIFHTLISSYGNMIRPQNDTGDITENDQTKEVTVPNVTGVPEFTDLSTTASYPDAMVMKGKPVRMPKIPLHYEIENTTNASQVTIPRTYVACLIIPPAKLHEFYYRMRVTWTVRFEQVVPFTEYGTLGSDAIIGGYSHTTNYDYDNSKSDMDTKTDLVDANGVDVNLIMQS